MGEISPEFLRRKLAEMEEGVVASSAKKSGGGGDETHISGMDGRIGRLEGAIEGMRHSQNLMIGIVSLVALLVVGFGVYGLQRMDQINDKVAALPGQISSDLRDLTKTIADSITASKTAVPQVILMPAPPAQMPANDKKN
jgi:hypothetical protein